MDQETIKIFIEEAHGNAVEKGFYDCPYCSGKGGLSGTQLTHGYEIDVDADCDYCNGTGIDPNKKIGELLMLIVSELGEALEAHRCGRKTSYNLMSPTDGSEFSVWDAIELKSNVFERFVKDTFEDEIADVFIRLFDLCGYVSLYIHDGINDESGMIREYMGKENVGECLLSVVKQVCEKQIITSIMMLMSFCRQRNIPIQKHIEAKMAYNKTRPHKHGKEY